MTVNNVTIAGDHASFQSRIGGQISDAVTAITAITPKRVWALPQVETRTASRSGTGNSSSIATTTSPMASCLVAGRSAERHDGGRLPLGSVHVGYFFLTWLLRDESKAFCVATGDEKAACARHKGPNSPFVATIVRPIPILGAFHTKVQSSTRGT